MSGSKFGFVRLYPLLCAYLTHRGTFRSLSAFFGYSIYSFVVVVVCACSLPLCTSMKFNQPLDFVAWPTALEEVVLGSSFDQPVAGTVPCANTIPVSIPIPILH